jgi:hypothetical protein
MYSCRSSRTIAVFLLFALVIIVSCAVTNSHEGVYVAGDDDSGNSMIIELRENGKGIWKKEDEEVPFNWKIHGRNELRLHLKLGGVVLGTITDRTIEITLPGTDKLNFTKK